MNKNAVCDKLTEYLIHAIGTGDLWDVAYFHICWAYTAGYDYGVRRPTRTRPIVQKTKDGKTIKVWNSIADASRAFNVDSSCLIKCAKGKQHTSTGFKWEYPPEIHTNSEINNTHS